MTLRKIIESNRFFAEDSDRPISTEGFIDGAEIMFTDTKVIELFDKKNGVWFQPPGVGTSSDGSTVEEVVVKDSNDRVLIDDNADGNQYIGLAPLGSVVGDAVWIITKNDKGSPVQDFTHSAASQIWDDRATTVTYS